MNIFFIIFIRSSSSAAAAPYPLRLPWDVCRNVERAVAEYKVLVIMQQSVSFVRPFEILILLLFAPWDAQRVMQQRRGGGYLT